MTTTVSGYTKLPWRVFKTTNGMRLVGIGDAEGQGICDAGFGIWSWNDPEGIANAELIVTAVNAYPDLSKRVEELEKALKEARKITLETAEATGMHRPALICQIDAALLQKPTSKAGAEHG